MRTIKSNSSTSTLQPYLFCFICCVLILFHCCRTMYTDIQVNHSSTPAEVVPETISHHQATAVNKPTTGQQPTGSPLKSMLSMQRRRQSVREKVLEAAAQKPAAGDNEVISGHNPLHSSQPKQRKNSLFGSSTSASEKIEAVKQPETSHSSSTIDQLQKQLTFERNTHERLRVQVRVDYFLHFNSFCLLFPCYD